MKKKTTYDLRTERMDYIFDTHAHYDDEAFDADREEVLAGLKAVSYTHLTLPTN